MKQKPPVFQYLDSINYTKENIYPELGDKNYIPYTINHMLSGTLDTVIPANEMNIRPGMPKVMQYDYLRAIVKKRKRYAKWLKKEVLDEVAIVMEYYNYSDTKAREVLNLLSKQDLDYIKEKLNKGGLKK